MEQGGTKTIEAIGPLLGVVRQREELYFQLLCFVTKHIESSSNDLDNTIFQGFIRNQHAKSSQQEQEEKQLMESTKQEQPAELTLTDRTSKKCRELHRLSSRVLEILDSSVAKVRKTIFDDRGRVTRQFARFKLQLQRIIRREPFRVEDYMEHVVSYCSRKYLRQVEKVQKYVEKVTQGDDISLKELFCKDNSDVEHSPDEHPRLAPSPRKKTVARVIEVRQQNSEEESPDKKVPAKKVRTSVKKRPLKKQPAEQNTKEAVANKLLGFYNSLKLSKPEFLEDYIYNQIDEDRHRQELMTRLRERNKVINGQINVYVKRVSTATFNDINKKESEGANSEAHQASEIDAPLTTKRSSRGIFKIKRKTSAHLDSSSGNERKSDTERLELNNTIRNIQPRRRSSQSNHRPAQERSQPKWFVVQPQKVFDEEAIPQVVPLTYKTTQRFHPKTSRPKEKKNDNLRLKRLNNPAPVENVQSFCYQL